MARVGPDNGTRCSLPAFIRVAGIVHTALPKSISFQVALALFQRCNMLQRVMQYGIAHSAMCDTVLRVMLQYALQLGGHAGGILQNAGDGPHQSLAIGSNTQRHVVGKGDMMDPVLRCTTQT